MRSDEIPPDFFALSDRACHLGQRKNSVLERKCASSLQPTLHLNRARHHHRCRNAASNPPLHTGLTPTICTIASIASPNTYELQPLPRGSPSSSTMAPNTAVDYSSSPSHHMHTPIHPRAPTANLVSVKVLVSLIGQVAICGGFQMWAFYYVRSQPWYTPPVIDPNEELNTSNPENTAVFLISSFQYSVGCLVYTTGYPYRKNPITNVWLMASVTLLFLFSLYALFTPGGFVADLLGLVPFPRSFHIALFVAVVLNTILSFVFESLLSPYVVKLVKGVQRFARRSRRNRGRKHGSKTYKAVERSMQNDGEV